MFPSYLPVKAPDPGAYHFNFLGHNQKCLTLFLSLSKKILCFSVLMFTKSTYFYHSFIYFFY